MAKKAEGKMIKDDFGAQPNWLPGAAKGNRTCPGFSPFTRNRGARGHTGCAWNACQSYSHDSY